MGKWKVPPLWEGSECYIIGGGPSMPKQFDIPPPLVEDVKDNAVTPKQYSRYMKAIHDKHVIGVNRAYKIGNWIDVLFFGDCGFYLKHRRELANWPGLKLTCCPRFGNKDKKEREGIKYVEKDNKRRTGISNNPKKVSWNSNSGAASISIAAHLGVKTIYLLGFDMQLGDSSESHWHQSYSKNQKPPFKKHLKGFSKIAEHAKQMGIKIINLNPDSAINAFPKKNLKEVINA